MAVLLVAAPLALAHAQPYRWTDAKGRMQFGDTPPASAKNVKSTAPKREPAAAEQPQLPFELQQAQKDFPVTLYTAPSCNEPCEMARAALNRRGVPFTEVPVLNAETLEQVKTLAGVESVPVLVVGRTVLNAYEPARYQRLLDSAGYPKEGVVPARSQRAPAPSAGAEPPLVAEPVQRPDTAPAKPGPYDTSGLKSNRSDRPGPYDTSGLKSNRSEKPGPYLAPGTAK